jgi:hypothetical protein
VDGHRMAGGVDAQFFGQVRSLDGPMSAQERETTTFRTDSNTL